ncbi:MAG: hypothetical protein U1F57_09980 [bacterium]
MTPPNFTFSSDLGASVQLPPCNFSKKPVSCSSAYQLTVSPDFIFRREKDTKYPTTIILSPEFKPTFTTSPTTTTTSLDSTSVFELSKQMPRLPGPKDPRANEVAGGSATTSMDWSLQLDVTAEFRQRFLNVGKFSMQFGVWTALGATYTHRMGKVDVQRKPASCAAGSSPCPPQNNLLASTGLVETSSWDFYGRLYPYFSAKYPFADDRFFLTLYGGYLLQPAPPSDPLRKLTGTNDLASTYRFKLFAEWKVTGNDSITALARLTGPVGDLEFGYLRFF